MTHHARTGVRAIAVALFMSALLTLLPAGNAAARDDAYRDGFCRIHWQNGRRQVKRLIRCVERRWSVPGSARKAICVARRESGLRPRAYSRAGYAGLFQQSTRYWPSRARRFGFGGWSAFNGRANTVVSIRMADKVGWSHWGTAPYC